EIVQPSVNYFADRLHITPNYLSDVVRYHSGKPALEHIHEHIVAQAKQLLAQKRYSVSEIAYQLGFEYPSYFTRLFRKQTGTTPSQYRNR
ncbi:MAG: helix-turn-helix domain-containing protein, partial [Bacteroidota bacterium]